MNSDFTIHIPTLVVLSALIAVLAAIMLTANWRINRNVHGTHYFAITHWLWAFGLLLYIPRETWSPAISVVLANMLIILGTLTFLRGVCRYQKVRSAPLWLELIIVFLLFFGYYYWTFVENLIGTRVVMLSIYSSIVMIAAFLVLSPTLKKAGGVGFFVSFGIITHALFFVIQAFVSFFTPESSKGLFQGGGAAIVMLLEGTFYIFWSTLSFALLTSLELQRVLKNKANRDSLTKLLNRRAVFEISSSKIEKHELQTGCVLVLDLDHFKNINDEYGHLVGDKVLVHFSNLVSSLLPNDSIFGRTGGEEFIVLLGNTSLEDGKHTANKICESIRHSMIVVDDQDIKFTVSIGVANGILESASDLRDIINKADKAMYSAKENGRDRYEVLQMIRGASTVTPLFSSKKV